MRPTLLLLGAGAVAGAILVGVNAGTGGAATAVAADSPPHAVEDFQYPHADAIFTERGIRLKSGDGHIVLADCAGQTGLVELWARGKDKFCFRVTGNSGYLTLELPQVYGIKGNDYKLRVDMSVDDTEVSFDVDKNTWTPVGESADPEGRDHMLLEIFASK
jgi:hypothetical protein